MFEREIKHMEKSNPRRFREKIFQVNGNPEHDLLARDFSE